MAMKPDVEIPIALATSVLAYGAYQYALPSVADIRSLERGNVDVAAAERTAAWVAAGMVSFVALITRSPSVFVLGGATVIAASWMARHADQVDAVQKRAAGLIPAPARGPEGVVGDQVVESQQMPVLPVYGVAV